MNDPPEHDEISSARKDTTDDTRAAEVYENLPPALSRQKHFFVFGGIFVVKMIVLVLLFNMKQSDSVVIRPPVPERRSSTSRKQRSQKQPVRTSKKEIRFRPANTRDHVQVPLSGFDPAGEPSIAIGRDGKVRLHFELMPPSFVSDRSTLGSFADFDKQIAEATGAQVLQEDEKTFVIHKWTPDVLRKTIDFLQNYPRSQTQDPFRQTADQSTVTVVCQLTAELLGVEPSEVQPKTSLGDLHLDRLDAVELVMELEEHFEISIPDSEFTSPSTGEERWEFHRTTMAELAALIDASKQP